MQRGTTCARSLRTMKIWTPALLVLATACGVTDVPGDDEPQVCEAGHCDTLPFADQLKGRQDPIAKFYQSLLDQKIIDAKGVYHADLANGVEPADNPLFYQKLLTGLTTMRGTPIMNELPKPWRHWNAGEGSVSESFVVPDSLKGKPNWEKYGATAAAASRFEKVIRDANANRVTPARSKQLFKPAKLDDAMGLIRPLFCDEQVNYVSELNTGEVTVD